MEFSKDNLVTISETICPEMLIFGKYASWTLSFQNILTNPIISEISFLRCHTLVLYCLNIKEQYSLRGDQNDFLIKTYPNDAGKMSVR